MDRDDRNVIIFEGPDACGKTTQANLLAKRLKNCILIHSPRTQNNTTKCFKLTNETLYNKKFMTDMINAEDKETFMDYYNKLSKALIDNIEINFQDRIDVIENMKNIYSNESKINFDFSNKNDYQLYYEGEHIINPSDERIEKLINKFQTNPRECYFILDRFMDSSRCYNEYIPAHVINEYKVKCVSNIIEMNERNVSDLEFTQFEHFERFKINMIKKLVDLIIETYADGFSKMYKLHNFNNFFFTRTLFFKKSKLIKHFSDKYRINDKYDKNEFIITYSDQFYQRETSKTNYFSIDTDELYFQEIAKNENHITNYIEGLLNLK